jgi:hypothetical protein
MKSKQTARAAIVAATLAIASLCPTGVASAASENGMAAGGPQNVSAWVSFWQNWVATRGSKVWIFC